MDLKTQLVNKDGKPFQNTAGQLLTLERAFIDCLEGTFEGDDVAREKVIARKRLAERIACIEDEPFELSPTHLESISKRAFNVYNEPFLVNQIYTYCGLTAPYGQLTDEEISTLQI
jgi:hypothetical protein